MGPAKTGEEAISPMGTGLALSVAEKSVRITIGFNDKEAGCLTAGEERERQKKAAKAERRQGKAEAEAKEG